MNFKRLGLESLKSCYFFGGHFKCEVHGFEFGISEVSKLVDSSVISDLRIRIVGLNTSDISQEDGFSVHLLTFSIIFLAEISLELLELGGFYT